MRIKLTLKQWKALKEIVAVARVLETESATGKLRLDGGWISEIEIYEDILITLPEDESAGIKILKRS